MKNSIAAIIILATGLTSCVIESYEEPKKTIIGYSLSEYAGADIATASSIATMARIVDRWNNATTDQERYEIEDKYLGSDIKLRKYDTKISIVNYYDIMTSGKSLTETEWEVVPLLNGVTTNRRYYVSLTATNDYSITITNSNKEPFGTLTMKEVIADREYSIEGNSSIAPMAVSTYYDKIAYTIAAPLKLVYSENGVTDLLKNPLSHSKLKGGNVEIMMHKEDRELTQDKTIAVYSLNGVEISFRGSKEFYTYNEYFYE